MLAFLIALRRSRSTPIRRSDSSKPRARTAATILVAAVVISVVPHPLPQILKTAIPPVAAAADDDLALIPPTGWSVSQTLANDGNDATSVYLNQGYCHPNCAVTLTFTPTTGAPPFPAINSFRVLWSQTSSWGSAIGGVRLTCAGTDMFYDGSRFGGVDAVEMRYDTGRRAVTGTMAPQTAAFSCTWWMYSTFSSGDLRVYTMSLWLAPWPGPSELGPSYTGIALTPDPVNIATGNFTHTASDLALPGRVLGLNFTRAYNSADATTGPLGPGWTHEHRWSLSDAGATVTVRQGDGRVLTYTRNADQSYSPPLGVFDTLVKNADATYTFTRVNQVAYAFSSAGALTRISEPAGNQLTFAYTAGNLSAITDTVGRQVALGYDELNRITSLQDPLGRRVTYWYDTAGRLAGVRDKLMNASLPAYPTVVQADTPAGYWRLGEASGTLVADSGPSGVNGTTAGGATRGRPGIGTGLSTLFDGTSGAASVPSAAPFNFGLGDYSVEAWLWRTGSGSGDYPVVVSKRAWVVGTEPGWAITLPSADPTKVALHVGNLDANLATMQTASGLITANVWHHLALVYTQTDLKGRLYVDGTLALTTPATDGVTGASSSAAISFAASNAGSRYYQGKLAEVALYARALSASQVSTHYGTGMPPQRSWTYGYDGATSRLTTITDPDGRVRVTNSYDGFGRVTQQRDGLSLLTQLAYSPGQTVVTDARNNATTYTFDGRFRELSESIVVSGTTRTLAYAYDAAGNRSSVTDRNGKTTDFTYDPRGNLLTKTDPPVGTNPRTATTYQYDTKNNLTQITDPRSFTTGMTYDPTTNVLLSVARQIDATTSALTKYQYTDPANAGLPTRIVAPRGNTTATPDLTYSVALVYDTQGNLTRRTDADGAVTTYTPDGVGRITSRVDPDGNATGGVPADHTWSTAFDENDRVTRETDPLGRFTTYGYDGAGDRTALTDRSGNVTTYAYDANTRLRTVGQKPDPAGQPTLVYTTTVNRDNNGNARQVVQANGVTTDYAFDELNRLTSVTTHPTPTLALTTSYLLDGNGNPTTRTTADGVSLMSQYDVLNRLTSVSATGIALGFQYDAAGNRTQMTDATGTTTYQYDGLGRMTQAAAPGGTMDYSYDADSNRTTLSYPGPASVAYGYSPGGRLSTVTDWAARQTSYTYTASGLAKTVTLPASLGGLVTTYGYDRAQRLTSVMNGVGAATVTSHTYTLDGEGNRTALDEFVSGLTAPAGGWLRVAGATRTAQTATPPTAAPLTWSAGALGAPVVAQDKLIAVVITNTTQASPVATSALSDSLGNTWVRDATPVTFTNGTRSAELSVWSAVAVAGTPSLTLAFASAFTTGDSVAVAVAAYRGLLAQAGPAGVDLARLATGLGFGTNAADSGTTAGTSTAAGELKLGLYADLGDAPQALGPGTLDTTYGLAAKIESSTLGELLIEDAASGPAGSTARATASLLGSTAAHWGMGVLVYKLAPASGQDHFGMSYDGLSRLTSVTTTNPEGFSFDAASNITSRSGPAASYAIDGANRPTGDGVSSFTWSDADRLTGRGSDTFAYDPLGRLTSSTVAGANRTYTYNGDGLLASATAGASTTSALWDPSRAPAPLLLTGTTRLVYGLGPLYADSGTATTAFARDGLGSVRAELSATGSVTNAFRYAAYGKLVQSISGAPATLGYAGELADPSGLIYLRARWYDPTMGRFMTSDSWMGRADTPSTLNSFAYTNGNPALLVDPTGRCPFCLVVVMSPMVRGAFIGALSYGIGLAASNALEGRPLGQGFSYGDLALAMGAGALTGGLLPQRAPLLQRLVTGGLVAGATEGVQQLLTRRPNVTRLQIAVGLGMYGGLYNVTATAAMAASQSLIQAVQDLASDVVEAHTPPADASPASSGGK